MINDQNVIDLCKYRFEQAKEALCEAKLLQEAGHYRGAINRAYYAMFYSLQVLVIINIEVFSDRVEIISPETLPAGIALEDIGQGISEVRNRQIVKIFRKAKIFHRRKRR